MTIHVYIDSCAWNYLYEKKINLQEELPASDFTIHITREVEIELEAIPDDGPDGSNKRGLKAYIHESISASLVKTSATFGFFSSEPDDTPSPIQVFAGFGQGIFMPEEERAFYDRPDIKKQLGKGKRTGAALGKNQADASLASKSFQSIVLTNERIGKAGPLKIAREQGGVVVHLKDAFAVSGKKLGDYLKSVAKPVSIL